MAIGLDIDNAARMRKQEIDVCHPEKRAKAGEQIFGDGALEVLPDGFGFLCAHQMRATWHQPTTSTSHHHKSADSILHTGDSIEGEVRTPKDGERYFALVKVDKVNGEPPEMSKHRILFENLTPLHPSKLCTWNATCAVKKTPPVVSSTSSRLSVKVNVVCSLLHQNLVSRSCCNTLPMQLRRTILTSQ